ncbi:FAD-dependent oxidoreductase [Gaiella sp.]|uniref:flavin monoamine oxidase family protein n=3 Tax=Gaiella sp. TaxID=2663207 RepID=UPI0032649699
MNERDADVVVIGAGVAGLVAASDLVAAGREVVVLEARDRVGGRLLNTEIGGEPNELGGQWIAPYQSEMHALLAELGLESFHAYREGDSLYIDPAGELHRYAADTEPLPATAAADYARAVAKLDALCAELDPEAPWEHPLATELDGITFEQWLAAEVDDTLARDFLRSNMAGGYMTKPADSFSLLGAAATVAGAGSVANLFEPDLCLHSRIVGGSQLIPLRLAERLGDRVVVGAPARTLRWSEEGVDVEAGALKVQAQAAVVAVPPNVAGFIRFEPSLPAWRMRLHQALTQGDVIKVLAVYDEPFWRAEGLSGEGFAPYQLVREVYDNTPPVGRPGVLCTFLAGEKAQAAERLDASERRRLVLDGLARYFGSRALDATEVIEHDWSQEEWTRGAYAATFGVGGLARHGADLTRPVGPIQWACTDLAGVGHMHMEGAIRSGRAAARAILADP